ncbi:MAG: hypothetical protein QOJ42_380, partial [Acidobacteriaceae bacterium]|nr:hypothetical protein [Acidobacteriaceae bacterium]
GLGLGRVTTTPESKESGTRRKQARQSSAGDGAGAVRIIC